ncbi:MAG: aldose 1-epimerase family protein [Planctomycetes bacterium]|nr:aldose 1-epimerase family protein [Planctomycetota bacterium]
MAGKTWVLTDVAENVYTPELSIFDSDVGGAVRGYSVAKRTLRGGLSEGVDEVLVRNGDFSFAVLPTRGMGIWKAWLGDWEIGWRSPVRGPVHPQFVPLSEPSGLGWLDGFDELLVRCGLESNGAPDFDDDERLVYPLHGQIANRPAQRVELQIDGDRGEIRLVGVVEESRFLFKGLRMTSTITTRVGETSFTVRDEVENLSSREAEAQLLYHINFGAPLLEAGAQAIVPAKIVAPKDTRAAEGIDSWNVYGAEEAGFAEQVYFFDLHADADQNSRVLLKNAAGTRGVSLGFNKQQSPHFILWKNTGAMQDGYVTGLEPSTNFPHRRTFEGKHGRVVKLPSGGKAVFEVQLSAHGDARSVEQAEAAIRELQGGAEPEVLRSPRPGWSPE